MYREATGWSSLAAAMASVRSAISVVTAIIFFLAKARFSWSGCSGVKRKMSSADLRIVASSHRASGSPTRIALVGRCLCSVGVSEFCMAIMAFFSTADTRATTATRTGTPFTMRIFAMAVMAAFCGCPSARHVLTFIYDFTNLAATSAVKWNLVPDICRRR
jgi:hypothetical protein